MNSYQGEIQWKNLCEISRYLTNGLSHHEEEYKPNHNLVYMSDCSIGGRECNAGEPVHEILDGSFGSWWGYEEEGSHEFVWESATSGAALKASNRKDGLWFLTFSSDALGQEGREMESLYLIEFIRAVKINTVQEIKADRVAGVVKTLKYALDYAQNNQDLYLKIMEFARGFALELK